MPLDLRVLFGYIDDVEILVGEKVKVLSLFENGKIKPEMFFWRKRIYRILRIVFTYSKSVGKERVFFFSVECNGPPDSEASGIFELSFNREKFSWEVSEIY